MSYRYIESILPEAQHYRHRPTADQLVAAVDCLLRHQWCRELPADGPFKSMYRSAAEVRLAFGVAPEAAVRAALDRGVDDASALVAGQWPPNQREFTPGLCEDVHIVSSPWLLMADHGGMESGVVKCPACGGDVLRRIGQLQDEELFAEGEKRPQFVMVDDNYKVSPPDCPLCGAALRHEEMVLVYGDQRDPTPFFHFAIEITAIRQPTDFPVHFDPAFLAGLSDAIGVPVRSIGGLS